MALFSPKAEAEIEQVRKERIFSIGEIVHFWVEWSRSKKAERIEPDPQAEEWSDKVSAWTAHCWQASRL